MGKPQGPEYQVTVVCKNEKVDVAGIKTAGPLDATTIRSAAFAIDGARFPYRALADGEPMRCLKCSGKLWFRLKDGTLHEAIPGALTVAG